MPRRRMLLLASLLPALIPPPSGGQGIPDLVTVRLFENRTVEAVTLVVVDSEMSLFARADQDAIAVVRPGDSVKVVPAALGLLVSTDGVSINQDALLTRSGDGGSVDVTIATSGQATTRRYPGSVAVSRLEDGSLKVTNTVQLETYVASVVGREYALDDEEGTRAMAVVARTFAVRALVETGETGDGLSAQVYHGLDAISDVSRAAAEDTRSIVLTYDDRPILSVYSASNGGYAARNSDVWSGEPLPYLESHRDRFDRAGSPYNDWLTRLSQSRVHDALSDLVGASAIGFSIEERSRDGRVKRVRVKIRGGEDIDVSGSAFRRVVSRRFGVTTIRSTLFDVSREGDHYVFEGSGYGHGVGLSQWGAHEMANRGYNFKEILRFYYPDTETQSMSELGFDVSAKVAIAEPASESPDANDTVRTESDETRPETRAFRGWAERSTSTATRSRGDRRVGW